VCVCVCVREREREREVNKDEKIFVLSSFVNDDFNIKEKKSREKKLHPVTAHTSLLQSLN